MSQVPPAQPPPPGAVPPTGGPPGSQPLPADQERLWAMLAHLLSFVAAYIALGFIAPLVVLLVFGPRSAYVRAHAVESLNFNLSWLLYAFVGVVLIILGIASVRAINGEFFRYPLTIRFIR